MIMQVKNSNSIHKWHLNEILTFSKTTLVFYAYANLNTPNAAYSCQMNSKTTTRTQGTPLCQTPL